MRNRWVRLLCLLGGLFAVAKQEASSTTREEDVVGEITTLLLTKKLEETMFGIQMGQDAAETTPSEALEPPVVVAVRDDSPAARAGVRPGDVVLRIGNLQTCRGTARFSLPPERLAYLTSFMCGMTDILGDISACMKQIEEDDQQHCSSRLDDLLYELRRQGTEVDIDVGRYPGPRTCAAAGANSSTVPPAFVINLKRRPERLARFQEQAAAAGMSAVEPFPAVDTAGDLFRDYEQQVRPETFRELVEASVRGVRRTHRSLSPGALGVALSHVAVAQEALKRIREQRGDGGGGSGGVLVFEDDAQVPPDFLERLAEWTCQLPADWELLLLGWWDRGGSSKLKAGPPGSSPTALRRVGRFWMMHAYFINESGLEKLVHGAGPPVDGQLDEVVSALASSPQTSGLVVYGVDDEALRLRQGGHDGTEGSDVSMPVAND